MLRRSILTTLICGLLLGNVSLLLAQGSPTVVTIPTNRADVWSVMTTEETATAAAAVVPEGPEMKPCTKLLFGFTGEKHQWVILGAGIPGPLTPDFKAVRFTYRAVFPKPLNGFWVIVHTRAGAEYLMNPRPAPSDTWQTWSIPLASLSPAPWSKDAPALNPAEISEVRIAIDGKTEGPGKGRFWLADCALTRDFSLAECFPPRTWGKSADAAAEVNITAPAEGPKGENIMRMDFTFPGGKHMYAFANTPLRPGEAVGQKTLRLVYKGALPAGLAKVRLMVIEKAGASYTVQLDPAAEWRTVDIPLSSLTLGSWSKDDNSQFDAAQAAILALGTDGQVTGDKGTGVISLAGFEFLP